jgi:protein-disulfide isomerase
MEGALLQGEYFVGGASLPHPLLPVGPFRRSANQRQATNLLKSWLFVKLLLWCQLVIPAAMARPTIILTSLLALAVMAILIAVAVDRERQAGERRSDDRVVATVGGRSISLRQVESAVSLPLYVLETQRHQLLLQATQTQIDEQLIEAEASHEGLTVPELIDRASRSESISRMADLPGPVKRVTVPGQQVTLEGQDQARIRQALIVSLRRKTDVHIMLPPLEPPIVSVSADDDPRLGPDDAPVTIIEFSDFQCPFCRKSAGVLRELRRIYGDKIRLIYRDFPGANHPAALPAAEASECAHQQGKFWEYHDLLFERQAADPSWNFIELAKEIGLDSDAFSSCLNGARFRPEVDKDLQDGLRLGVTSTPTFFINGRPLIGAHPISAFQDLINQGLADHIHP